jgi:hypothetical protein
MFKSKMTLSAEESHGTIEPDSSPSVLLIVLMVILTIVLFAVGYAVKESLQVFLAGQQQAVDLSVPNPELVELRAQQNAELSGYDQLDAGHYRIPIESAMDALVRSQSVAPK